MAKKEVTVELLTETIIKEGISAAQALVADKKATIEASIKEKQDAIKAAETALEDLERSKSMIETLLVGAYKRAASESAIVLTAPAAHGKASSGGQKRSREQTAKDRETIVAALPTAKDKALSISDIAAKVNRPVVEVRADLFKLKQQGRFEAVGDSKVDMKYYRKA